METVDADSLSTGGKFSRPRGWTDDEDAALTRAVQQHGVASWCHISKFVQGRTSKQCRERWHNQLKPEIYRGAWTGEEDKLILDLVKAHGRKWAFISRQLPGRTDNAVKKRFDGHIHRRLGSDDPSVVTTPLSGPSTPSPGPAAVAPLPGDLAAALSLVTAHTEASASPKAMLLDASSSRVKPMTLDGAGRSMLIKTEDRKRGAAREGGVSDTDSSNNSDSDNKDGVTTTIGSPEQVKDDHTINIEPSLKRRRSPPPSSAKAVPPTLSPRHRPAAYPPSPVGGPTAATKSPRAAPLHQASPRSNPHRVVTTTMIDDRPRRPSLSPLLNSMSAAYIDDSRRPRAFSNASAQSSVSNSDAAASPYSASAMSPSPGAAAASPLLLNGASPASPSEVHLPPSCRPVSNFPLADARHVTITWQPRPTSTDMSWKA